MQKFGAEFIQKYLEMFGVRVLDDFSGMGFFGEEVWAGNGWTSTLKSQLSLLLGCIRDSPSKACYKTRARHSTT